MKKTLTILLYVVFLIGGLLLYYSEKLDLLFLSLSKSDKSILMTMYSMLAGYFSAADTWNWIFVLLAITVGLNLYVVLDLGVGYLSRKALGKRFPFLASDWYKNSVQKLISLSILFIVFVSATNIYVNVSGASHLGSIEILDSPKPVLVLGTSKMLSSGKGENLYYSYRIDKAIDLWNQGKVDYFILSGDGTGEGRSDDYDEIRDMTNDLVAKGVPSEKIKADTAGYRTLDSMLRIRQMFCTKELVIVSQSFHVARAAVLATFYGIKAIGMPANGSETFSMMKREVLSSKPKLMLDILFANMQPAVKVESTCMKNQSYRSAFSVQSDLHIILILLIGVGFFSSLGVMFKYIG
ncbi:MAG: ElyC/SanA/YdcF family protein [Cyclobacteriaceae bacterium]